jgi:hypothetical protein
MPNASAVDEQAKLARQAAKQALSPRSSQEPPGERKKALEGSCHAVRQAREHIGKLG